MKTPIFYFVFLFLIIVNACSENAEIIMESTKVNFNKTENYIEGKVTFRIKGKSSGLKTPTIYSVIFQSDGKCQYCLSHEGVEEFLPCEDCTYSIVEDMVIVKNENSPMRFSIENVENENCDLVLMTNTGR